VRFFSVASNYRITDTENRKGCEGEVVVLSQIISQLSLGGEGGGLKKPTHPVRQNSLRSDQNFKHSSLNKNKKSEFAGNLNR
jgi:hypothetical protein